MNPLLNGSNVCTNGSVSALANQNYPDFKTLEVAHFEPAIDALIQQNEALIDELVSLTEPSWETFFLPLQASDECLSQAWLLLSMHNAVLNTDELRPIYERVLKKITAFQTKTALNTDLYEAYERLSNQPEFKELDETKQTAVMHILRDFRLSGVALPADKKPKFAELSERLSALQNQFSQNVLDATEGWSYLVAEKAELDGIPESSLEMYRRAAQDKGEEGYLLTLDLPSYLPLMTYCKNRDLRERLYMAYITRASDQGAQAGEWDNSGVIEEILALRHEQSQMLDFANYADRSVARKMASSSDDVMRFLVDLADKSSSSAQQEFKRLQQLAQDQDDVSSLQMWDLPYYSEQLKQQEFGFSKEALRPYFPADKVLDGMFQVAQTLFGIDIQQSQEAAVYHEDVRCFDILIDGAVHSSFYVDLYARQGKRGGAWLASCRSRYQDLQGNVQKPIAFLTCNFTPPSAQSPSLLTPEEVTTLFHEFGHCLHYTLTRVDVANVSCIRNVPWDAVELPSQMLENWCFQEEVLPLISGHYETGEQVPADLIDQLKRSQCFLGAMQMVRQLEFALFDFRLHREYVPGETDVLALTKQVRDQVAVCQPPAAARFSHAFSHIFAGGYAAGYYSYKWAEVLSADAFSRFEEEGLMSAEVGQSFKEEFLELGGSKDVMEMFQAFRGRKPSVEPLLRLSGIN